MKKKKEEEEGRKKKKHYSSPQPNNHVCSNPLPHKTDFMCVIDIMAPASCIFINMFYALLEQKLSGCLDSLNQ